MRASENVASARDEKIFLIFYVGTGFWKKLTKGWFLVRLHNDAKRELTVNNILGRGVEECSGVDNYSLWFCWCCCFYRHYFKHKVFFFLWGRK